MDLIHILSILLEVVAVMLGVMIATNRRKKYGWFIALTFFIYVFYDLVKLMKVDLSQNFLYFIIFIATASIVYAIWQIYKEDNHASHTDLEL